MAHSQLCMGRRALALPWRGAGRCFAVCGEDALQRRRAECVRQEMPSHPAPLTARGVEGLAKGHSTAVCSPGRL